MKTIIALMASVLLVACHSNDTRNYFEDVLAAKAYCESKQGVFTQYETTSAKGHTFNSYWCQVGNIKIELDPFKFARGSK